MPKTKDLEKLLKQESIEEIYAQQYDIVLNGNEI
jgi:aspartyl-tRNA synthetase